VQIAYFFILKGITDKLIFLLTDWILFVFFGNTRKQKTAEKYRIVTVFCTSYSQGTKKTGNIVSGS